MATLLHRRTHPPATLRNRNHTLSHQYAKKTLSTATRIPPHSTPHPIRTTPRKPLTHRPTFSSSQTPITHRSPLSSFNYPICRFHQYSKHPIFQELAEEAALASLPPQALPTSPFGITAVPDSLYNNPTNALPLPSRTMSIERSEYLKSCDLRSISQGVQLIFGDWDQDLIVINKPFGIPMAANHRDNITDRIRTIIQKEGVYPVHRLDKYTSGCLVVALNPSVARVLQNSLQNHTLASIKTTENNFKQKVKSGEIRDHLKSSIRESLKENQLPDGTPEVSEEQEKNNTKQHSGVNVADTQWSKRYRVMVQLTPCVKRDLVSFMNQEQSKSGHDGVPYDIKFEEVDGDLSKKYLELYDNYIATKAQVNEKLTESSETFRKNKQIISLEDTNKNPGQFHSPDLIRSPHQQGSLYTAEYSSHHSHHHDNTVKPLTSEQPPPLLSHGFLHSHLIHRDFVPTDWIHENDIVHVEHITQNLENRLKSQDIQISPQSHEQSHHSSNQLLITESNGVTTPIIAQNSDLNITQSYTDTVGLPSIDDIRIPVTHTHSSLLLLQPPTLSDLEYKHQQRHNAHHNLPHQERQIPSIVPLDLTNPSHDNLSINTIKNNPKMAENIQEFLNTIDPLILKNIRDSVEYRVLPPGAPKPPDNDDDDAEDQNEIKKSDAFCVNDLQNHLLSIKCGENIEKISKIDSLSHTPGVYDYFSRLISAEGIAISPFHWINAKIQLLEQVFKLHAMSKINPRLVKTAFRKSSAAGSFIQPNFNLTAVGANAMNTIGKMVFKDTASHAGIIFSKPGAIQPRDQDGNIINIHAANVYIADQDEFTSKKQLQSRQHPLMWTSHRVLFKFNTNEAIHPVESFHNASRITPITTTDPTTGDKSVKFVKKLPEIPAIQPYELDCGCMLPYTTPSHLNNPAVYNEESGDLKVHNKKSLLNTLPASAPHPFIPTNYLYESTTEGDNRIKFVPNKNIHSLPQDVPQNMLTQFDEKERRLEVLQREQEEQRVRKNTEKQRLRQLHEIKLELGYLTQEQEAEVDAIQQSQLQHQRDANDPEKRQRRGGAENQLKLELNNARVVDYDYDQHNNHINCSFGSLISSEDYSSSVLPELRFSEQVIGKKPYIPSQTNPDIREISNTTPTGGTENIMVAMSTQEAKEATTLFRISHLNLHKNIAIYNAKLLSGRTHQLRIHFSDAGLPIRGDGYYNPYYVKHWTNTYLYNYFQRLHFNQHLRSIYIRPLFGHADSGVTAQLTGIDTWNGILTPLTQPNTGLVTSPTPQQQKLLSHALYNTDIQSNEHFVPTSIMAHSKLNEKFAPKPSTFNLQQFTQTIPPSTNINDSNEFSQEELEYYLNVYKSFANTTIDGEMFLQSYMIEFPLPESLSRPRQLRKDARRQNRSARLQERLLNDIGADGEDTVDINNEKDAVLAQLDKHSRGPKQAGMINPKLSDGLPLYHSRMSPEEVKAERERKKREKQLYREKKEELEKLMNECVSSGVVDAQKFDHLLTIRKDAENDINDGNSSHSSNNIILAPNNTAKQTTDALAKIYKTTIEFVDNTTETHLAQAEQFYSSPDDLDQYTISADAPEGTFVPAHPDGFYEIRELFSAKRSPLYDTIHGAINSDEFHNVYDPTRQLAVCTLQPSPAIQSDAQIAVHFNGEQIKTNVSNVLHLSTDYKSWTFKTKEGVQMVRILLGVPGTWKYAM